MPVFLLANWKWILPSALAAVLGVMLVFSKLEVAALELSIANQKVEAANQLAAAYAAKAKKEQEDAETARKVDEAHKAELAAAHAGRDAFAERLREARRRASCPNTGSGQALDPGKPPTVTQSGDVGLGQAYFGDPAIPAREGAKELVAFVNGCHQRLLETGR